MSWLTKLLKKLGLKQEKKENPPEASPPQVVAPSPPSPTPATPSAPTTPEVTPMPQPPLPGETVTMMRPVIGVTFAPGSVTPIPLYGEGLIPVTAQTVRFGEQFPYPRVEQIDGVNILLEEPMNKGWKASVEARTFGGTNFPNGTPRTIVGDPSNAPEGFPRRSPAGWPLFYPNVAWDAAQKKWVGTPSGPARISFNGTTHDNDLAVQAYVEGSKARDAALAEWQRNFNATFYLGPIPAGQLTKNDMAWLYRKSYEYRILLGVPNGDLHRLVLSGSNLDVAVVINTGEQHDIQTLHLAMPDGPRANDLRAAVDRFFAAAKAGAPEQPKFEVRA